MKGKVRERAVKDIGVMERSVSTGVWMSMRNSMIVPNLSCTSDMDTDCNIVIMNTHDGNQLYEVHVVYQDGMEVHKGSGWKRESNKSIQERFKCNSKRSGL